MESTIFNDRKSFFFARDFFIRSLGVIFFIAFSSLWVQVIGLIGEDGILPAKIFLKNISGEIGSRKFLILPTVFWISVSDFALHFVCALGVIFSILLCIGFLPLVCLVFLYILYLSILSVGQVFLSFQWDVFLLEVGFLSIFFTPWTLWLHNTRRKPSRMILLLLRLILFKLMFMSAVVKILSGDPVWTDFTALTFHYWTQPIPNPLSWFIHHFPLWFQKMSCFLMFVIELIVPFGIFVGIRSVRLTACWLLMYLQVLILMTGNYCFFNLLTIGLCILLIDDGFFMRYLKVPLKLPINITSEEEPRKDFVFWSKHAFITIVVTIILALNAHQFLRKFVPPNKIPRIFSSITRTFSSFAINNSYGLFAVMTKDRPEIIFEGSLDGITWKAYELPFKAGNLKRMPPQVAPHQPRLDWQLWFAALRRNYRRTPWTIMLMKKLLEGSEPVEKLFASVPFPDEPPKYIRAHLFLYEFTTPKERRETGQWWKRKYVGPYAPILSLDNYQ